MANKEQKELQKVLKEYPVFKELESGRLQCQLTGHEVPNTAKHVQDHVKTKRFVNEWLIKKVIDEYEEYFENLGHNLLGCKLTLKTIARKGKDLEHHINGQKFKNAWKKEQEKKAVEAAQEGGSDGEKPDETQSDAEMEEEPVEVEEKKPKATSKAKAGQKRKIVVKRKSGKVAKKA
ncbi:unnamed protein product [Bursaphelenchus okinawaensis]|uniref:Surfeit locus protein 2 n=1 Tax=Bursaphelenchus okinawaensis TaxID=465554 RepID=A0A811LML2_9BILA|nr:unnamed protein product [Bursaphelenchus okinawaensis]CAG9124371.1 unnamed protein product [Bursaphelenchus okinawaensis]